MKCFLCHKNNFSEIYRLKNKKIVRCLNDDLYFSTASSNKNNLYNEKYYNDSPYPNNLKYNYNYFINKLNKIFALTGEKNPRILDIGCGWGSFLEILREKKQTYLGIDTATAAIDVCSKKNLNCQLIDEISLVDKQPHQFSAITCFQVIEHLTNPFSFLAATKKLLKKGGVVIFTTPNNDSPLRKLFGSHWSVYNTSSHFVFYNKNSVLKTMNHAGYKNVTVRVDQPRFLSLKYAVKRLTNINLSFAAKIPVVTDPWGDLEIISHE